MPTIEKNAPTSLREPGSSAKRRDSLIFEGKRGSITGRRDSVSMSLLEHAEMNRMEFKQVEDSLKLKEIREKAALSLIGKVIYGFQVRKKLCNIAYSDDMLRRCQLYMRHAPRVGIYFRYCLSFFKQHVLHFRMKNVTGLACQQFVKCCIVKDFDCGAVICRQGDNCDFFYVLIEGQMTITQRLGHVDKVLGTIKSGTAFGEFGIIRQTHRTATITAATKCSTMMIDKNSFLEILHISNPEMVLKKTTFLLTLPIFQSAPRITLEHLSHVMTLQNWKPYDFIYRRCRFGGFDDRLLIVLSGHVDVFLEPFLSENELSQRMIKHNSRTCTCYTTKVLQESHSTAKSWLPCAKERGKCVSECGAGSFLNIHCLIRSDSPDCCIIAGPKGASILVVQKIDFISIVEKGKSNQLFQMLAEQSWDSMHQRRNRVSELSFSKFPYRELVGQSMLISRPSNDFTSSNIAMTQMKRFLSGPRHNRVFPPLDLHRISSEKQQTSLNSRCGISCVGKEYQLRQSSSFHNASHVRIAQSPKVSRAMKETNFLYPKLQHQRIDSQQEDEGSSAKDCTSIFAAPAGNSVPFVNESAKVTDSCPRDCDYFDEACVKFSQDLKEVQSFLRQTDRNNAAVHPLISQRYFAPRAPELPQDIRSLGVRGARIIASARSQR